VIDLFEFTKGQWLVRKGSNWVAVVTANRRKLCNQLCLLPVCWETGPLAGNRGNADPTIFITYERAVALRLME